MMFKYYIVGDVSFYKTSNKYAILGQYKDPVRFSGLHKFSSACGVYIKDYSEVKMWFRSILNNGEILWVYQNGKFINENDYIIDKIEFVSKR